MNIISLMTDFGLEDPYVGVMHGVIYGINPDAKLTDLTHNIQPQKIQQASFLLSNVYGYFPASTVHLVVVDPGVGTERRAICIKIDEVGTFVGPDNGIFSYIIQMEQAKGKKIKAHQLTNPTYQLKNPSPTFHGRDVFAPAAAYIAKGVPIKDFGPALPLVELVYLDTSLPRWEIKKDGHQKKAKGEVMHIDHFGNIITNIPGSLFRDLSEKQRSELKVKYLEGKHTIKGLSDTYNQSHKRNRGDALNEPQSNLINLVSSYGFLETALPNGNAALTLGIKIGDSLTIQVAKD